MNTNSYKSILQIHEYKYVLQKISYKSMFQIHEHKFLQKYTLNSWIQICLTEDFLQKYAPNSWTQFLTKVGSTFMNTNMFYRRFLTKVCSKFMNTISYKSMLQIHEQNFLQRYAPNSWIKYLTKVSYRKWGRKICSKFLGNTISYKRSLVLTKIWQKILAKCSVLSGGISTTLEIVASLVAIGASEHPTWPVTILSSYSILLWSPELSRCKRR